MVSNNDHICLPLNHTHFSLHISLKTRPALPKWVLHSSMKLGHSIKMSWMVSGTKQYSQYLRPADILAATISGGTISRDQKFHCATNSHTSFPIAKLKGTSVWLRKQKYNIPCKGRTSHCQQLSINIIIILMIIIVASSYMLCEL